VSSNVRPKPEVGRIFIVSVVTVCAQLQSNQRYHQVREILASIDKLNCILLLVVVHLFQALSEPPPVWDKA
jgi:hypothetical protein